MFPDLTPEQRRERIKSFYKAEADERAAAEQRTKRPWIESERGPGLTEGPRPFERDR